MKEFFYSLNDLTMACPQPWGGFHIACLALALTAVFFFTRDARRLRKIPARAVFGVYGVVTFLLELTKQLMWSIVEKDGSLVWEYSWYSAPFQFCTMPLYISLILLFVRKEKLRGALCSFLGFFSVISMALVMLMPGDVFTDSVLINIHTMFLHAGGLALALFVLVRRLTAFTFRAVLSGFVVFLVCVCSALVFDVVAEETGVTDGETFNMFYISPYEPCTLPVFSEIKEETPYPVFLLSYVASFFAGACGVCGLCRLISRRRPAEA